MHLEISLLTELLLIGIMSDRIYNGRRAPVIVYGFLGMAFILGLFYLSDSLSLGPYMAAIMIMMLSFFVNGAHGMIAGAASMDFGGRKATATSSGILDGFVYLGTGLQSFSLGYLTTWNWHYWPIFLMPFALIGMILAMKIYKELPEATRKYIAEVEDVAVTVETIPS